MLKTRQLGFIVFLIISIALAGIAFTLPKDQIIIDNFEDKDISDWDESAFETESYTITSTERGNIADIEIKTGQDIICKQGAPPIYCQYGSFQKTINKNLKGYNKISYWLKFSHNYENINRIRLSFGDIVSGGDQNNKANYDYQPKNNDWQLVSFNINNPDSIAGELNLQHIKKLRFNIEYGNEFYKEGKTFHVYIDDIKLTKYSLTSLILFILSITFFTTSIISLFWRETQRKLRKIDRIISNLSNKRNRAESIKIILNSTFQLLLILFLLSILINEFYLITFINLNYFLITVLIFGVLTVLLPQENVPYQRPTKLPHLWVFFLGILGAILIYIKTKDLGILSYIISAIAGLLIILLSYLVLEEDDEI